MMFDPSIPGPKGTSVGPALHFPILAEGLDLAIWDLVFGTFQNPAQFAAEAGFYDGASARVSEMLLGRDVQQPPATSDGAPAN
jgi:hypothetical protein